MARRGRGSGRTGRAAAGAFRIGNTVGAALTAQRPLGAAEAPILGAGGLLLVVVAAVAAWWPAVVAYPIAGGALWLGASLGAAAWRAWRPR
jgi:cardiolipin synthase